MNGNHKTIKAIHFEDLEHVWPNNLKSTQLEQ
jgi:hypothetical protein